MSKSITIKTRTGIDTYLIELLPGATVNTGEKTLTITWLVFFIEISVKCVR